MLNKGVNSSWLNCLKTVFRNRCRRDHNYFGQTEVKIAPVRSVGTVNQMTVSNTAQRLPVMRDMQHWTAASGFHVQKGEWSGYAHVEDFQPTVQQNKDGKVTGTAPLVCTILNQIFSCEVCTLKTPQAKDTAWGGLEWGYNLGVKVCV